MKIREKEVKAHDKASKQKNSAKNSLNNTESPAEDLKMAASIKGLATVAMLNVSNKPSDFPKHAYMSEDMAENVIKLGTWPGCKTLSKWGVTEMGRTGDESCVCVVNNNKLLERINESMEGHLDSKFANGDSSVQLGFTKATEEVVCVCRSHASGM